MTVSLEALSQTPKNVSDKWFLWRKKKLENSKQFTTVVSFRSSAMRPETRTVFQISLTPTWSPIYYLLFIRCLQVSSRFYALIKRERKSSQVFSLCTLVPRLTANLRWLAVACASLRLIWACSNSIATSSNLRRLANCLNTKVLGTCLWGTFSMDYHKKRIM